MEHFHVRPLSESDIHAVISAAGGDYAYPDSDRRRTLNADFLLAESIIELKALDDEGLAKPQRQAKLANLFRKEEPSRPVIVLDRAKLPTQEQRANRIHSSKRRSSFCFVRSVEKLVGQFRK